nr:unnamed protein product [Digitaria exilis]
MAGGLGGALEAVADRGCRGEAAWAPPADRRMTGRRRGRAASSVSEWRAGGRLVVARPTAPSPAEIGGGRGQSGTLGSLNLDCACRTALDINFLIVVDQSSGLCMTAPVALSNELEGISHSARVELFRDSSCNISKELSTSLRNGQDANSAGANPGFRVGEIRFSNGDVYSGTLLGNTPEGSGRYLWSDGCIYDGEWRKGMRHGQGKTWWPSRATYEGEYSGGYIYGEGTYTGPDNIIYRGRWKLNRKHGLGFQSYPNGDIFEGSWIQGEIQGHGKYTWANECTYIGNMKNGKMSGKGTLTWKNGDSYEGNWLDGMMHGYTVGKITPIQKREVRASDFGPKASFWMNFPKQGSRLTPSHSAEDFKWKDYCPMVFRNLREMFKIDAADYMISICGNSALRELSSPGKSGSVFFLSQDDRFMIKTLRKSEVQVLLRMLPNYYNHVRTYENTLITKFFGLHRVKPSSGQKFRFVVMGNMFCTELRIHRRFDLKGSSLGRSTDKIEIDENTTLKDLDLNYSFYLEPSWREALLKQIETDSEFLRTQQIMDYSLLLGVHYRAPQHLRTRASYRRSMAADRLTVVSEEDAQEDDALNYPEGLQIQLGVNMPARAEQIPKEEESKPFQEVYDVVLYLGIIDILQEYNMTKKIEHAVKSMQYDSVSISAVDPQFYSERFLKFIQTVFPENS